MQDNSDKDGEHEEIQSLRQILKEKNHVIDKKEQQLRQCREELTQQIQQQNQQILQQIQQIQQLERDKQQGMKQFKKERERRELGRVNQQLEESEQPTADFGKQSSELEEHSVATLRTGTALIVAGGFDDSYKSLKTVEVLNTETQQWHTAPDLPEPLARSSLALCGDLVYLLGGFKKLYYSTHSVYSCLLNSLFLSESAGSKSLGGRLVSALTRSNRGSIWNRVADLPVTLSTGVTLHGQLLAIGGRGSDNKPTVAVHVYQPTDNSWEVISHMTTPRLRCLAAVLPDNQLMVVGGRTTDNLTCDSVECGRVI